MANDNNGSKTNGTNNSGVDAQTKKEKETTLELAVANIEKQFGKGSIMRLGNTDSLGADIEAIPTGSLGVDLALGVGGFPRGRVVEIYGPESSGKTTLTLHVIAEAQKRGGIAAFIDAEHALDVQYARRLGGEGSTYVLRGRSTLAALGTN